MSDPARAIDAARAALQRKHEQLESKRGLAAELRDRVSGLEAAAAAGRQEVERLAARVEAAENEARERGHAEVAEAVLSWLGRQPRDSREATLLAERLVEWGKDHANRC